MKEEKMDMVDRSKFSHCVGTGNSRYAMVSDAAVSVIVAKYIDSIIDLKIKITDHRKDREYAMWMSEKEAQLLLEALKKFYE